MGRGASGELKAEDHGPPLGRFHFLEDKPVDPLQHFFWSAETGAVHPAAGPAQHIQAALFHSEDLAVVKGDKGAAFRPPSLMCLPWRLPGKTTQGLPR